MNSANRFRCVGRLLPLGLSVLFLGLFASQTGATDAPLSLPQKYQPAAAEFSELKRAVTALLQGHDTERFAREIIPSSEDWKAIASTNLPDIADNLESFAKGADNERRQAEQAAKVFLDKAASLHLDFSKGDLQARVADSGHIGRTHYPSLQAQGETLPLDTKTGSCS